MLIVILVLTILLYLFSIYCAMLIAKKVNKFLGFLYAITILVVDATVDIFISPYVGFGFLIIADIITIKLLRK